MTSSMISMILWAPFVLVMLIAGLIFITAGYKKGLYTALFSLIATVLSLFASLPLANLLGEVLGELLVTVLSLGEELGALAPMIAGVAKGIASVVLFGLLFFFITLVLKLLMQLIVGRHVEKQGAVMCAGGVVVRVVDTVLYSLLLLLPLYGTLGVYGPTASTAVELLESSGKLGDRWEGAEDVRVVLETLTEHPLVIFTAATPAAQVYDELASFDVNDTTVSPVELMKTAAELSEKIKNVLEKDNRNLEKDLEDLIAFMDSEVLDADWTYAICMSAFEEVGDAVRQRIPAEEKNTEYGLMVDRILNSLGEMNKREFKKIGSSGLTFVGEYLRALSAEGFSLGAKVTDDFFVRHDLFRLLGETFHSTKRMAEIRTLYCTSYAQHYYSQNSNAVSQFLRDCREEPSDREDVILADGRLMAHLAFISDDCTMESLFRQHPYFGDAAFDRAASAS